MPGAAAAFEPDDDSGHAEDLAWRHGAVGAGDQSPGRHELILPRLTSPPSDNRNGSSRHLGEEHEVGGFDMLRRNRGNRPRPWLLNGQGVPRADLQQNAAGREQALPYGRGHLPCPSHDHHHYHNPAAVASAAATTRMALLTSSHMPSMATRPGRSMVSSS